MTRRRNTTKEKNQQYDAVYYLRNKIKRNAQNKEYAMRPEQKLYRQLYARWRMAIKGKKVPEDEPFNKPPKEARLKVLECKKKGCAQCASKKSLELDHKDTYPNNNALQNLQWLCHDCHLKKTEKERQKGIYSQYQTLAKKPLRSRQNG